MALNRKVFPDNLYHYCVFFPHFFALNEHIIGGGEPLLVVYLIIPFLSHFSTFQFYTKCQMLIQKDVTWIDSGL